MTRFTAPDHSTDLVRELPVHSMTSLRMPSMVHLQNIKPTINHI